VSSGAQKPFFIGIDSDGTAFDSMEIKHKRVFQPIAVEIWGLHPWLGDFYEIAELINLYSTHRGVNRFQGLAMAFERLSRKSAEARTALQGYDALRDFVLAGIPLSASSLADYNSNRKNKFLSQTLEWSQRCDQRYAQIMEDEGNPPYSPVTPTLQRAFPKTEVVVISSSSKETLLKDWGDAALLSLTDHVAGQENGIKPAQLKEALRGRHEPTRALMIGDAPGDLEAARASGILFYPILPGSEQASWQRLQSEALDRFFEGSYAGDYESALLSDFQSALIQGGAWPESDRS
jgi:phosphoglycolate phosphatase-like HAD superfamily hydrolase